VRKQIVSKNDFEKAWEQVGKVEAISSIPESVMIFDRQNMLAKAVHTAFYDHHPLRLSPDVIWIAIAQGFANHVNENSETLRSKFVSFEGKQDITISRPEFVKGSPKNDWVSVFPEFSDEIEKYIGANTRKLLECNFSTTGTVERTVSQIVLMDAVKSYFKYNKAFGCGIPFIELTGTPDDWISIRNRALSLREFKLDWWIDHLVPVLDQFVTASHGKSDISFWTSICNLYGGSGMRQPITGWIQTFFPYLLKGSNSSNFFSYSMGPDLHRNSCVGSYAKSIETKSQNKLNSYERGENGCGSGVSLEVIPGAISKVPFTLTDLSTNTSYKMVFAGGVVSVTQDASDGTLEPRIGWAVLEAK